MITREIPSGQSIIASTPVPNRTCDVEHRPPRKSRQATQANPTITLIAALLGFFAITLDAVVVNVALPSIRNDIGGGMTGLQWVVDGYTLMFAALLLSAGSLSDRLGAKRAFGAGVMMFVVASLACGLAPSQPTLVAARLLQGAAAAVIMPSSMALIGEAYPDPVRRARAIALWAMGGAVASTSGTVLGGVLAMISWRWIFLINIPIGAMTLILLTRTAPSPRRPAPFDWIGQITGILAMSGLVYGAIEAGAAGFEAPDVRTAFAVAILGLSAFLAAQKRGSHPMMPLDLFRNRNVVISMAVGFAFMVGYFGLPFVMSLYLQQMRDLTSLQTGLTFLPMMLIGLILTPFSARIVERLGARTPITTGLVSMVAGLVILAFAPASAPVWVLSALMLFVGLTGPLVAPPITAVLLNSVPSDRTGTASGIYNTSRQIGGALAIAVFGALLANEATFMQGTRTSLLIAAAVALGTAAASPFLRERRASERIDR
ncbi:MAG TPA: MFS transporter [Thermomicrobiales bacterium]|nr:MFS transporter [Thermomicrobiales bacterium]